MATIRKPLPGWEPVKGQSGFYSKAVQAPNLTDPAIRRVVEALQRQFDAIDDDVDKRSQEKYVLYGFNRKR
jgi:hypothetical protein